MISFARDYYCCRCQVIQKTLNANTYDLSDGAANYAGAKACYLHANSQQQNNNSEQAKEKPLW